jgi:hypothetical protein
MTLTNGGRGLATLAAPARNHYFYSKLMDVPHVVMEQTYFNRKRWLLNRLGLGEGILCGLEVTAKDKLLCVAPGVAVDALGREIIVPEVVCLENPLVMGDGQTDAGEPLEPGEKYHLCLAYRECPADFMPVLVTDCNTREQCEPGTIIESYALTLRKGEPPRPTVDPELCQALTDAVDEAVKDKSSERRQRLAEHLAGGCEVRPESACVVLAGLEVAAGGALSVSAPGVRRMIYSNAQLLDLLLCVAECCGDDTPPPTPTDTAVKSASAETGTPVSANLNATTGDLHFVIPPGADGVSVRSATAQEGTPVSATFDPASGNIHFVIPKGDPGPPGTGPNLGLTKVNEISWGHEGQMTIDQFMEGLSVIFSGDIQSHPKIDPSWFLVAVEYPLPAPPVPVVIPLQPATTLTQRVLAETIALVTPVKARFAPMGAFKATYLDTLAQGNVAPDKVLCRVVVKCSFLLDAKREAVDGDFLKGQLPSGDGIPGGDFESWFYLTP